MYIFRAWPDMMTICRRHSFQIFTSTWTSLYRLNKPYTPDYLLRYGNAVVLKPYANYNYFKKIKKESIKGKFMLGTRYITKYVFELYLLLTDFFLLTIRPTFSSTTRIDIVYISIIIHALSYIMLLNNR